VRNVFFEAERNVHIAARGTNALTPYFENRIICPRETAAEIAATFGKQLRFFNLAFSPCFFMLGGHSGQPQKNRGVECL
jgi:hypothetical protein